MAQSVKKSRKVGGSAGNRGKGRKKGVPNKTTASVKQAIIDAFARVKVGDAASGVDSLVQWGSDNPSEFYKLWGRLAPTEIQGTGENGAIVIRVVRD